MKNVISRLLFSNTVVLVIITIHFFSFFSYSMDIVSKSKNDVIMDKELFGNNKKIIDENIQLIFELIDVNEKIGDNKKREKYLKKLKSYNLSEREIRIKRAEYYFNLGKINEALKIYYQILSNNPDDKEVLKIIDFVSLDPSFLKKSMFKGIKYNSFES